MTFNLGFVLKLKKYKKYPPIFYNAPIIVPPEPFSEMLDGL